MKNLPLFFTGALLFTSVAVTAQNPAPSFSALDVNQDGYISESEALYHGLSEKKFKVWDTNGDDMLSQAEYEKGVEEKGNIDSDVENY